MKLLIETIGLVAIVCSLFVSKSFAESSTDAAADSMASPHYAAQAQPPFRIKAEGIDWEYEVRVSLPGSYGMKESKSYPVLWVLDGSLYHGTAAEMANVNAILGRMPYVIVVSVGYPAENSRVAYSQKRIKDFRFEGSVLDLSDADDPATQHYKKTLEQYGIFTTEPSPGNGAVFLDFLVDTLRPLLSEQYRMSDKHVLYGHSGGGMFTSRSLFARPGEFSGYIVSSGTSEDALRAEKLFAESNEDLDARVFVAAGDLEVAVDQYAGLRLVSNTIKFAESLALRNYPSLDLEVQLHHAKDHATVWPLSLGEGMIWAFSD